MITVIFKTLWIQFFSIWVKCLLEVYDSRKYRHFIKTKNFCINQHFKLFIGSSWTLWNWSNFSKEYFFFNSSPIHYSIHGNPNADPSIHTFRQRFDKSTQDAFSSIRQPVSFFSCLLCARFYLLFYRHLLNFSRQTSFSKMSSFSFRESEAFFPSILIWTWTEWANGTVSWESAPVGSVFSCPGQGF